jgi:competence protein ComEC
MMNPGGFDYEGWLFRQHIGANGYVRSAAENHRLAEASRYSVNHWRQRLQDRLKHQLADAATLPLIIGLGTGIRSEINNDQWSVLRRTGTSHLLAISGLHIGLAATLGYFLLRWLWSLSPRLLLRLPAQQAGAIGAMAFALFYAFLAGLSVPTQRALVMVATVLIGLLMNRPLYISHLLALSLLLVLAADPFSALSAGFWLSYAAVSVILFACSHRFPVPCWQWAGIHLWIAFGLTPLLLLFFHQTSLIAPIANLVAVPLVSLLVVPLLLLAMLMLVIFEPLAGILFQCVDLLLGLLWHWLEFLADIPVAEWRVGALPLPIILLMLVCTLVLLMPRGMPARWLGLCALLPPLLLQPERPENKQFWFTLLDVGQGLAAVVETRSHVMVFDTGARFSDSFDTGSAVAAPFLQARDWKQIDRLVISHADNDHAGGMKGLLNKVSATEIISSDTGIAPSAKACIAGQHWRWDGIDFKVLSPFVRQDASDNNRSCVVKVSSPDYTVLLTGDIEKDSETSLIRKYGDMLRADVLVVPHHGSRTSSSNAFIDAVRPHFALFSVGYRNRYGFPAESVVGRYRKRQITTFSTDKNGAIMLRPAADGGTDIRRWRHQARNLWTGNY